MTLLCRRCLTTFRPPLGSTTALSLARAAAVRNHAAFLVPIDDSCVPCPEPVLVDFLFHLKFQERKRFCAGYVYYGRMTDAQIKTFATRCGRLMKDYGPVRPTLA